MKYKEEVCCTYGARMTRKHKREFREFVIRKAQEMGYDVKIEKNLISQNVVVGNSEKANYLVTAHYDTPPRMPKFFIKHMLLCSFVFVPAVLLSLTTVIPAVTSSLLISNLSYYTGLGVSAGLIGYFTGFLGGENKTNYNDNSSGCLALLNLMEKYKDAPKEIKEKLAFVFFDNEEKFLLGSLSYAKKHKKQLKNQKIINLDCIGKGEQLNLYHFGRGDFAKELSEILDKNDYFIPKVVKSNMMSTSDHLAFKKYDNVCLLSVDKDNSKSLYSQIHSSNDTSIDDINIEKTVELVSSIEEIQLEKQSKKLSIKKQLKNAKEKVIEFSEQQEIMLSVNNQININNGFEL